MQPTEHGLRADLADGFDLARHRCVSIDGLGRSGVTMVATAFNAWPTEELRLRGHYTGP